MILLAATCTSAALARPLFPTRGVWANFEERNALGGYFNGDLLQRFNAVDPIVGRTVSDEVAAQLDAMRGMGINTVTFEIRTSDPNADKALNKPPNCGVPPALGMQWPQPTQTELAGLVAFFDLVHAKGLRVMLLLNNTHMEAPPADSGTWIGAILGAIKTHPAFDFVTFGGDTNIDNGACGIPAEPALWLGINGVQSQYVKWAINYGMTTLGIAPAKLSAEAIVGDAFTDAQDITASGDHMWPPVYTLKQIFDSLAIPDSQRTYALSFYTRPKCYAGLSIPCTEIGRAAWTDQMAQNVLRFVGPNTQARIVAAEMGNYDSTDPSYTTDQAIATLMTVMAKYGFDGGSFWRWSTNVNSDETNPVFATPVVKRGAALDYYPAVKTALSAYFQPLIVGAIFSSAQTGSQSFLRFYNTGSTAGTVTVTLLDGPTGNPLGQWTSPSIAAGAEQQFSISSIESGANLTAAPPATYQIAVQTAMTGYFQHVLWRAADGTLTNLSTCASGVTSDPARLSGVHSSLLDASYPSSIVVNNLAGTSASANLDIFDARTGAKIASYLTASIPAHGELLLPVDTLEAGAHIAPSAGMYHYTVVAQAASGGPFNGFVQHLVRNLSAGVVTDMTTACALSGAAAVAASSPLNAGAIFSSAQAGSQSYLRFLNTGPAPGTVTVTLNNGNTGQQLGQWTSPPIPAGAEQQFPIATVENGAGSFAKPPYYTIAVQSQFAGYFQHVLWRSADGTLTNLSTCGAGVTADPARLGGVHSSLLDSGYAATVAIANTGSAAASAVVEIDDARDGSSLGVYSSAAIPAMGEIAPAIDTIEQALHLAPGAGLYHYVFRMIGSFTGYLQDLVSNQHAGVITDMTTACALKSARP